MKKTLVALAALAATGASFAQVTITGNIGVSYQLSPELTYVASPVGATTTRAQGLQIQDGEINVTATEDLGGGWSATAKGGLTMRGRDTAPVTRDATVSLRTPVGLVTAGAIRTCGPWESAMSGVVSGPIRSGNENNTATPLPKCSLIDFVSYTAPVGPVTLTGAFGEFGGGSGNATGLTFQQVAGVYTAGPLLVGLDLTSFGQTNQGTTAAGKQVLDGLLRTRVWGSYNFGVAKLGLGYQSLDRNLAATTMASLSVPMGNVTFGLEYAARDKQGVISTNPGVIAISTAVFGATNGDKASSSVGVGATYNFSKLTNLNVSYITYQDAGANSLNGRQKLLDDEYRVRLLKSF